MSDFQDLPSQASSSGPQPKKGEYRTRTYAAAFAIALTAVVVGMLSLGRTDWFIAHSDYPALGGIGYSQWIGPQNCQVLIYGDSSAAAALDPAVIEKITRLKTCNVSEWSTVQQVVGSDLPLRRYLAHNLPPRVLLTTWAPGYFRPDESPLDDYHIEGLWYAWRYGTWWNLRSRRLAQWTAPFVTWEMSSLLAGVEQRLSAQHRDYDPKQVRNLRHGQWPFLKPPEDHCVTTQLPFTARRWEQSVLAFRQKYTIFPTQVIVDVSPVPDCNPHYDEYERMLHGLYDNTFQHLPVRYFNDSDIHLGPDGSKLISEQAAAQVLSLLATKR